LEKNSKKEILFYYESRQNPNGDPGFEDQPRLMSDGTIMVTDVRIKRTIRDYAKNVKRQRLFVDYDKDGNPMMAHEKAKEILESLNPGSDEKDGNPTTADKKADEILESPDIIKILLTNTYDVPMFGAFIPKRSEIKGGGGWEKLTGPVQFGMCRSINKVNIIHPTISTHFVGREKKAQEEQFSTLGRYYAVEYALIKVQDAINPVNLETYYDDPIIKDKFNEYQNNLCDYLWNGTNQLITRSKFPQRSILYIDIEYNSVIYNDLSLLVEEKEEMKGKTTSLSNSPFIFNNLIQATEERKDKIKNIRIKCCHELNDDVRQLVTELTSKLGSNKVQQVQE
jgi:CRISPR-associated protein Csh2